MAKRKKTTKQSSAARQARIETRKAISTLRKAGLIGRGEFRGKKPGGSAYKLIRKYQDVIRGEAIAVKPSTRLIPKALRKTHKARRGLLVIPKPQGTISSKITRAKGGVEIRRTRRTPKGLKRDIVISADNIPAEIPAGKRFRLTMPNWGGESARYFETPQQLQQFLGEYKKRQNRFEEFVDLSITDLDEAYDDDDALSMLGYDDETQEE
jgi:hypothetical protein